MQKEDFATKVLDGLKKLRQKIYDEMEERPFRHDFANIIVGEVLGWTRERGKGHYEVHEIRDIICFDDKEFPVVIVETKMPALDPETKRPVEPLKPEYEKKLKKRLEESGAEFGILTNGHRLNLYQFVYETKEMKEIAPIDIDTITQKEVLDLTPSEIEQITELSKIKRTRFLLIIDADYFIKRYGKVKVSSDEGFEYLIQSLRFSLNELTRAISKLFDLFMKSKHKPAEFLKDSFQDWCHVSGRKGKEAEEIFCKETSYVLLNRILFTRIGEDKEIFFQALAGHGLASGYEARERKKYPWLTIFKDACEDARDWYEHFYMIGMFDWWEVSERERGVLGKEEKAELEGCEKDLDFAMGEALRRFNPFDFSDVNRDILGQIYQEYLPPDERKRLGEFYTPVEVVRYILDAVGYTVENKIEEKYLLDPACGSGTFLVEAVTRLIERCRKKGMNIDDPNQAKLVLEGIIEHIYGLDINPFACHIAEMNLLFHLIEFYEKVREKDRHYKSPRFNIYCTDSLMPPEMGVKKLILEKYELMNARAKAFLDEEREAVKIKKMNFDFVVGNPPYVEVKKLIPEIKENYEQYYKSARKQWDIYVLFLERGFSWLRKGGIQGFIISDQFMLKKYGEGIRDILAKQAKLLHIIDFKDTGVFEEVTNYPAIVVFEKPVEYLPLLENQISIVSVLRPKKGLLEDIRGNLSKRWYQNEYYSIFSFPQSELSGDIWRFVSPKEREIRSKIEKNASKFKLKQLLDGQVFNGITTGNDSLYIVHKLAEKDGLVKVRFWRSEREALLEAGALKPIIKGEYIEKFCLRWDNLYVLFPYEVTETSGQVLQEKSFKEKFPETWKYFSLHEKEFQKREHGKMGEKEEWYAFTYPRNLHRFGKLKIVTPEVSQENTFAIDEIGCCHSNDVYSLILKKKYKSLASYVVGLLNSAPLDFYYRISAPVKAGGYFEYKGMYIAEIPIKLPYTPEEYKLVDKITDRVSKVHELNKQLINLKRKINTFPEEYLKNVKNLDRVAWIMDSQELKKDSYKVFNPRIESFKDLSGQTKYKLTLAKGNYITFSNREQVEYVLNWLRQRDRVSKNEILELGIPLEDNLHKIMSEYEKDKKRLDEIKQEVKKLEDEIDELVFDLYGLSKDDKEVINSFLETRA